MDYGEGNRASKKYVAMFHRLIKTFVSEEHLKMWKSMSSMAIPEHSVVPMRDLCMEQVAKGQVEQDKQNGSQSKKK